METVAAEAAARPRRDAGGGGGRDRRRPLPSGSSSCEKGSRSSRPRRDEIARQALAATLRERLRRSLPEPPLDPGRLEQEAALWPPTASDVAEELQRLEGHLDQFGELLATSDEPVGKTLDFLTQEILRELNTLGSKSRDLRSTREVLDMKAEIEKIREQVQNVE